MSTSALDWQPMCEIDSILQDTEVLLDFQLTAAVLCCALKRLPQFYEDDSRDWASLRQRDVCQMFFFFKQCVEGKLSIVRIRAINIIAEQTQ